MEPPQHAHRLWLQRHIAEQGDRCHYCGCRFSTVFEDPMLAPTLDHVIALGLGGPDTFENTVAACRLCNQAKADMAVDQIRDLLPHRRVGLLNWMLGRRQREKNRKRGRRHAMKKIAERAQAEAEKTSRLVSGVEALDPETLSAVLEASPGVRSVAAGRRLANAGE